MDDRRLIEDYLPLDEINAIASKEKLHPRRYVELVHYWPARRPITASRAAIYATLVPAPTSEVERKEAKDFVARLAAYEPEAGTVREAREGDYIEKCPQGLTRRGTFWQHRDQVDGSGIERWRAHQERASGKA